MVPAGLFDLFFLLPAVIVLIIGIAFLARGVRQRDQPAAINVRARFAGMRGHRGAVIRVSVIGALLVVLVSIGLVVAVQFGAFNPVIAAPTAAQAVGKWVGTSGAVLTLGPDGTFTARDLPANAGEWTSGLVPASGSGRWHVGRFDPSEPVGVILSFSDGTQAEFQLEHDGRSLAIFYDLGDPDEGWSGQYRFVKL